METEKITDPVEAEEVFMRDVLEWFWKDGWMLIHIKTALSKIDNDVFWSLRISKSIDR